MNATVPNGPRESMEDVAFSGPHMQVPDVGDYIQVINPKSIFYGLFGIVTNQRNIFCDIRMRRNDYGINITLKNWEVKIIKSLKPVTRMEQLINPYFINIIRQCAHN